MIHNFPIEQEFIRRMHALGLGESLTDELLLQFLLKPPKSPSLRDVVASLRGCEEAKRPCFRLRLTRTVAFNTCLETPLARTVLPLNVWPSTLASVSCCSTKDQSPHTLATPSAAYSLFQLGRLHSKRDPPFCRCTSRSRGCLCIILHSNQCRS